MLICKMHQKGASSNPLFKHIHPHVSTFRDDYFVVLLDSGGSTIYSLSNRFSISSSASAASAALTSPVATVTVSGAPNPTMAFAATFAVSSATRMVASGAPWASLGAVVASTVAVTSYMLS